MKTNSLLGLLCFLLVVAPVDAASRVLIDGFLPKSKGVGPTPANQPSANDPFRYFQIYLPDGYDESTNKRYPVVYFLHGFGQNYTSYSGMFEILDNEIASGRLSPMIVVKPDGSLGSLAPNFFPLDKTDLGNGWLGSFFINSKLNGNFERYIVHELRSYINKHYRTKTDRASTGIAGHSMGAYGAILLSLKNPDVYSLVTAHTPSTIVAIAPQFFRPSFYDPVLKEIPTSGLSAGKVLPTNGRATYMLFSLSAALSPNLASVPYQLDLPVKVNADYTPVISDGKLVPNAKVLDRWLVNDPYTIVANNPSLLTHCLYIDYGKHETVINTTGVKLFESLLKKLRLDFKSAICEGTSFAQADFYEPSNDLAEALVHPALLDTANFIDPYKPFPKHSTTAGTLWDFAAKAVKIDRAGANAITLSNFGGFIEVVCHGTPPARTGQLLIDQEFLTCLNANGIDPVTNFLPGFFSIPGYVAIDPKLFSIDTDGFIGCCQKPVVNCPCRLFQSFK